MHGSLRETLGHDGRLVEFDSKTEVDEGVDEAYAVISISPPADPVRSYSPPNNRDSMLSAHSSLENRYSFNTLPIPLFSISCWKNARKFG
jgi:hypothetical protein